MADIARRDQDRVTTLLAVSNADNSSTVNLWADPVTHALLISGSITASPASDGTTGSAVPASASYQGLNVAGTLRGATGVNPTGTVYAQQIDLASVGGTTFALGQQAAAASLPIVLTAAQITTLTPLTTVAVTNIGTFAVQATLSAETTKVIGVTRTADGAGNLLTSTGNALDINIKTGNPTTITATQATGTNLHTVVDSGTITPTPTSNTGWSFNYQSALSSTKAQIKATAGTFGGYINLYNPNTAVTFIQVFNLASASVTVGTTAPDFVITLPGIATAAGTGTDRNLEITCGLKMSTGITIAATTTASGSTAPSSAIVGTFLFI